MNKSLCAVCHRPLRSQASIAAGVGPVCAGKQGRSGKKHKLKKVGYDNLAKGQPLTTSEALAAVRRVAGLEGVKT